MKGLDFKVFYKYFCFTGSQGKIKRYQIKKFSKIKVLIVKFQMMKFI